MADVFSTRGASLVRMSGMDLLAYCVAFSCGLLKAAVSAEANRRMHLKACITHNLGINERKELSLRNGKK